MLKFFLRLCVISSFLFQAVQAERLRLALEWLINPHHAPIIIAITQGFFAEEGLEVELIQAHGSLQGCIQASVGVVDLALTNEAQWIIQTDKGLDLEPVLTLIAQPLEVVISSVPLSKLKSKRIGHSSSGVGFSASVLDHILEQQGLTSEDITAVHTKYGLIASLVNGQVDAVINAYRTYAIVDLKLHGKEFYVYPYEDLGVPSFAAQVIVANVKVTLQTKQALQRALEKACQFLKENPSKAWKIFKAYKPELDTPANQAIWPMVIDLFKVEPLNINSHKHQQLKRFLHHHQLIKSRACD